jgi:ABC-type spermidine/putrescine transport system permease subunit II
MTLAWVTYRGALLDSGIVAAVAGIAAVLLGAGIVTWRRRASASVWAVLFGVLPGALIGESILAAYRPIDWIYSGWPIVVIGYVARYGWVGVLAAWLAVQASGRDLAEQARSDGAGELAITTRIRLAASMPILLCGAAIVAALSLSDIATASLVQVPSLPLISLILLDKYHRFEDGMLICLSLWLVAAALPGAILLAVTRSAQGALRN